jgi:hypothetical protein
MEDLQADDDAILAGPNAPAAWSPDNPYYPPWYDGQARPGANRIGIGAVLLLLIFGAGVGLAWTHLARQQSMLMTEVERLQGEVMLLTASAPPSASRIDALKDVRGPGEVSALATKVPLTVLSTPSGATVYLDGMPVGTTPLVSHYLDPGAYIVRATTGNTSKEQVVVALANDGPQTLSFVLSPERRNRRADPPPRAREVEKSAPAPAQNEPREAPVEPDPPPVPVNPNGRIVVGSTPAGADVRLEGRFVGNTPVEVGDIASGTYTLMVERSGHERWTSRVHVEPGQHLTIHAELERSPKKARVGW